MPIRTASGSKAIEELVPADRVLSRHEDDVEGAIFEQEVVEVFRRTSWLLRLTIDDRTIDTTPEHPFFVRDRGWTSAGELNAGDQLASLDGDWLSLQHSQILDQDATVYNVSINEFHTYFVGEEQWGWSVWSHNTRKCEVGDAGGAPKEGSAALYGRMITDRVNKAGEKLDDLFEFADPKLASRQGLGFAEEGHHFWPKWLGGPETGPLLNVRMAIHRGAGVGMHQRLNNHLVSSGLVPKEMIDSASWVRQNLTPSQIKRSLYQFYRKEYPNLPGVPKLLNDAARSVSF